MKIETWSLERPEYEVGICKQGRRCPSPPCPFSAKRHCHCRRHPPTTIIEAEVRLHMKLALSNVHLAALVVPLVFAELCVEGALLQPLEFHGEARPQLL